MEARRRNEVGSGLVPTLFGACAFLAFLLLAVNAIIGLYATSVISNAVSDASRYAAQNGSESRSEEIQAQLAKRLSGFDDVQIEWVESDGNTGLRVIAARPSMLPGSLRRISSVNTIDRTAWFRVEEIK